jgi:hypothetical protein
MDWISWAPAAIGLLFVAVILLRNQARSPIRHPGTFNVEAVGESHYQAALRAICGKGKVRHPCIADLVLEDDNAHDNQAVAVKINGATVGYLSRNNARRFRQRCGNVRSLPVPAGEKTARVGERANQRAHESGSPRRRSRGGMQVSLSAPARQEKTGIKASGLHPNLDPRYSASPCKQRTLYIGGGGGS